MIPTLVQGLGLRPRLRLRLGFGNKFNKESIQSGVAQVRVTQSTTIFDVYFCIFIKTISNVVQYLGGLILIFVQKPHHIRTQLRGTPFPEEAFPTLWVTGKTVRWPNFRIYGSNQCYKLSYYDVHCSHISVIQLDMYCISYHRLICL